MSIDWPIAHLDPVRRLRALAAGVAGAHVTERVLAAPLSQVWAVMTDFEGDFGRIIPDMRAVRVEARQPDRITLLARSRYGFRARLTGPVDTGWCWLQSRFLLIGIAAAAEDAQHTRIALTGGVRIPRRPALVPIGVRHESRRSLDRLETLLTTPRDN